MKTVVRWVGAVIGLAVFVLLVAIAIGTGLPIFHLATCSARFAQTPSTLYAVVEDDASSPSWRSDVRTVQSRPLAWGPTGSIEWIETYKNGQTLSYGEYGRHGVAAGGEIYMGRFIADPTLPFGGEWKYRFVESGRGTEVTIAEAGWVYNPLFRLTEQFFTGYQSTIRTYLSDLGRKYGESPSIACSVTTYANRPPDFPEPPR